MQAYLQVKRVLFLSHSKKNSNVLTNTNENSKYELQENS
jgi:hypothetical protein